MLCPQNDTFCKCSFILFFQQYIRNKRRGIKLCLVLKYTPICISIFLSAIGIFLDPVHKRHDSIEVLCSNKLILRIDNLPESM